jgi:hypothetical protein
MSVSKIAGAFTIAGLLVAQPCAAADLAPDRGASEMRSSAFAGLNVRVPMGRTSNFKPSARLQLSSAYTFRDARTGYTRTLKPHGLELGVGASGAPAMFAGGQEISRQNVEKLKLGGTGTTVLYVVGGIVVLGVVLLLAAGYEPAI